MLVAAVVLAASLLLALTLPDREPPVVPCPIGRIDPTGRCGRAADRRIPERVAIALVGALLAAGLLVAAGRMERSSEPPDPPPGGGSFPPPPGGA